MFNNYESLTCELCGKEFTGRRPAEGGDILCPACLESDETPVLQPGDQLPSEVLAEMEDGRGDDE